MNARKGPASRLARMLAYFARALPHALERLHLEWALREIDPLHPDVPWIVRRINELSPRRLGERT